VITITTTPIFLSAIRGLALLSTNVRELLWRPRRCANNVERVSCRPRRRRCAVNGWRQMRTGMDVSLWPFLSEAWPPCTGAKAYCC